MRDAPLLDRRFVCLSKEDRDHINTAIRRVERIRHGEATKFDRSAGRLYADLVAILEIVGREKPSTR